MSAVPHTDIPNDVPVFAVDDLAFGYSDEVLFEEVRFRLRAGETLQLSGGSGTGKSTLLRVLARLLPHTVGSLQLRGTESNSIPAQQYRRKVAYLQQLPVMLPGSVRDNLLLSFEYTDDEPPSEGDLRTELQRVELEDVALEQPASELSIGQQQRIAVLRLLFMQPEVLLLDEPTASLDETSASALLSCVADLQRNSGLCMVHVTHQWRPGAPQPTWSGTLRRGTMEVERT